MTVTSNWNWRPSRNQTTRFINDFKYGRKQQKPYFLKCCENALQVDIWMFDNRTPFVFSGRHSRSTSIEKLDRVLLWLHLYRNSPAISSHFALQYGFLRPAQGLCQRSATYQLSTPGANLSACGTNDEEPNDNRLLAAQPQQPGTPILTVDTDA